MSAFCFLLLVLAASSGANGAILLWGPPQVQTPAFKQFTDEDLQNLLATTDSSGLVSFKSNSLQSANNINNMLVNLTSAYIPNEKINDTNMQELSGNTMEDFAIIQEALKQLQNKNGSGYIVVLVVKDHGREKRKVETGSTLDAETQEAPYVEPSSEPVVYNASSPNNKDVEAMIYSSKPPLLKTNSSLINLGPATVAKMDIRDTYTRLIATIPVENGKITLRFKFPWQGGYWYLTSVEVEFVGSYAKQFNLTVQQELTAPRRFSYHCGGEIVFLDMENEIELYLFEIQAQPDAFGHRFSDAYNCVPFTTGPLCSGLFVTFILAVGLCMGLLALDNIKTMDKFDNQKTKQLSITVWD